MSKTTVSALPRDGSGHIGSCVCCGLWLPLRLAGPHETDATWFCSGCGAQYGAVLDKAAPPDVLQNVRPAAFEFQRDSLENPLEAIGTFIREMIREGQIVANRRQSSRHQLVVPVTVVPVDEGFCPLGQPFMAMTRDISTTGLSLIHTRAVPCQRLIVELRVPSAAGIQVVLQVTRCRALGRFYEIAGYFIMRLKT
jgi:hypothetical protein